MNISNLAEYKRWHNMITRCKNPNHKDYSYYGGRGIDVCDEWLNFDNFTRDMGERPTGMTLDRKNNDGNYEPGNCRWATRFENMRNSRATKLRATQVAEIKRTLLDGSLPILTIANKYGVNPNCIYAIKHGKSWSDIQPNNP